MIHLLWYLSPKTSCAKHRYVSSSVWPVNFFSLSTVFGLLFVVGRTVVYHCFMCELKTNFESDSLGCLGRLTVMVVERLQFIVNLPRFSAKNVN